MASSGPALCLASDSGDPVSLRPTLVCDSRYVSDPSLLGQGERRQHVEAASFYDLLQRIDGLSSHHTIHDLEDG